MTISDINRTLDSINKVASHAMAHILIIERDNEAQEYCQKVSYA
jgi:hypothetical protein